MIDNLCFLDSARSKAAPISPSDLRKNVLKLKEKSEALNSDCTVNHVLDSLLQRWNQYSEADQLEKLVCSEFKLVSFTLDLSSVKKLEHEIKVKLAVFRSAFIETVKKPSGWIVFFAFQKDTIVTRVFSSEEKARMFALLLYVKLQNSTFSL